MTHIEVSERTIRRGAVSLTIPPYDDRWEDYRFRCINGEYPLPCSAAKRRLVRELRLEMLVSDEMAAA